MAHSEMTAFNRAVEGLKQVGWLRFSSRARREEVVRRVQADLSAADCETLSLHLNAAPRIAGTINTETGEITDREYPTGKGG